MSMNFISAEEFLKQPEEVQIILEEWYNWRTYGVLRKYIFTSEKGIPIFFETQLRQFIEEKTNCTFDVTYEGRNIDNTEWSIEFQLWYYNNEDDEGFMGMGTYRVIAKDLLEAYWKVACVVAKDFMEVKI